MVLEIAFNVEILFGYRRALWEGNTIPDMLVIQRTTWVYCNNLKYNDREARVGFIKCDATLYATRMKVCQ
jgi:hypothetical protein